MATLDEATLNEDELRVLLRFTSYLRNRVENPVHEVWLFGSRARGDRTSELSDIDVLVVAEEAGFAQSEPIFAALHEAAADVGKPAIAWNVSVHVHDPAWLTQRRAVQSLFLAEVERDRIDLATAA